MGALGTATRRKPCAINLFSIARDRPGPLAESSNPAGAKILLILQSFYDTLQLHATNVQQGTPYR